MSVDTHKETLSFQTEVKQLLHLMIHSLYSNKEIFLRELVSNASDASDKLRFEALGDDALYEGDPDLSILIDYDKEARTLSITDKGIGMTRQEVIDNIGTIAHSGTRQFLENLTGDKARDAQLIGQFGVGFYSSFIVADRVTLETRRTGLTAEHGVRWTSSGEGEFEIETIERPERGTTVTLHLREGEDEFLDPYRLRNLIHKYSDHIPIPVYMYKLDDKGEKTEEKEQVNKASALWARPKSEISDEEYKEFYKHIAHDFDDPLTWVHSKVEGSQSYTTLFYVPKHAPFDLYDRDRRYGVKLYVKRVFIMDDAEQLVPSYLRFIRGVVDSDDLPLNISRELLQHNKLIDTIRAASVKKILGHLESLAKNAPDTYQTFWDTFGKVLKEGPAEDFANREKIAKLLRFASTRSEGEAQTVSLDDYVSRMVEGQEKIYYLTAETWAAARHSPHLEKLEKKGIEVLLMYDRVDEWMMSYLKEYDGKPMVNVAKGDLDLGKLEDKDEEKKLKKAEKEYKKLLERMKAVLGSKVKEVRISHRLAESPSCLVVGEYDMAVSMQKLLRQAGHQLPEVEPILEINPEHPLVQRLKDEADDKRFEDWTWILFDQALLSEGGQLDDPSQFVHRMNELFLLVSGEQTPAKRKGRSRKAAKTEEAKADEAE